MLVTARRRNLIVRLKIGGANWQQVADQVRATYERNRELAELPKGFDRRYAYKDFMAYLAYVKAEEKEDAVSYRELEIQRLDSLFLRYYSAAIGSPAVLDGAGEVVTEAVPPNVKAAEFCVKVIAERNRLTGAYAEVKIGLSGEVDMNVKTWETNIAKRRKAFEASRKKK